MNHRLPIPVIQPPVAQNLPGIQTTNKLKRQKIGESDFTYAQTLNRESIPKTKGNSQFITAKPIEEDKTEVDLTSELRSFPPASLQSSVAVFPGLKTVSESITTNYAHNLKEKEEKIKAIEQEEETKIIDSKTDEISLAIQRSIYKENRPYYKKLKSGSIRC